MLTVRTTTSGKFAVDDGLDPLLTECPCCGKALTEAAAKAIVVKVERGDFTLDEARVMVEAGAWR
jgi:hypothetical protein